MFIRSYLGFDLTMFERGKWTKLFDWIWADIDKLDGAIAAIIDPLSEVYMGDYVDPVVVKKFCRRFDVAAFERNMAVLLLMHTAKGGDTQKTPFGSAQWLYAARTTLMLETVDKGDDDRADAANEAVLRIAKGNLVKPGTEIPLVWTEDALLVQREEPDAYDKIQQVKELEALVLKLCDDAWTQGAPLSDASQARERYLPAKVRQAAKSKFAKKEITEMMGDLMRAGKLKLGRTSDRRGLKVVKDGNE